MMHAHPSSLALLCLGGSGAAKGHRAPQRVWGQQRVTGSRGLFTASPDHICTNLRRRKKELLHPSTALSLCIYLPIDPQVEDLHSELMKMRKEKTELQSAQLEAPQHVTQSRANDIHREMGRSRRHWSGNEYIIGWTKRGCQCLPPIYKKIPWNFQIPIYTSKSSFRPLILCTYSHIGILVGRHWQSTEYWHQIPHWPGSMQRIPGRFGFGFSLPHWWYLLNVSPDRGIPEKEGADLRIHRQTSTSDESEELRKTLEVCVQGGDMCRQRRRRLFIQSHAV